MNTSYHLINKNILTSQPAASIRFIIRLIETLAKLLFARRDDPAALHYITHKYPDGID